ncbi:MAG TPA: DUF4340 domain-containing protein [bacterium]|jgi:hypothetical protein|nr:DUF4340 domain-containing protein [bacterium]
MTGSRRTLVALAVAVALGLVYLGWVKVLQPRREKAKEDAKLIFPGTSADSLGEILLRKQGEADVRLVRSGGTWALAQPIQAPADQDQVAGLVSQLAEAKREEIVADHDADLHEFGLDSPTGAVTFRPGSPSAKALALFFGSNNPTGAFAYGMVDGRPEVFMTPLSVKTAALKSAADLRDKKVWSFDVAQVQSVDGPSLKLRRDKGLWTVTGPQGSEPAKGNGVTDWLGQLEGLRADAVPSEDGKGPFGLGTPKVLDLGLADGGHLRLLVGGRGKPKVPVGARPGTKAAPEGVYVQVAGRKPVFHLPDNDLVFLDKRASDVADRNAFLIPDQAAVERFEVSGAGPTLVAAQGQSGWAWLSRTAAAGEPAFDFSGFVSKFAGVQLLRRLPLSAKPGKPARSVRFYDGGNNLIETADFGPPMGGGQVVFSAGKAAVFLVTKDLLQGLPGSAPPPKPGAPSPSASSLPPPAAGSGPVPAH